MHVELTDIFATHKTLDMEEFLILSYTHFCHVFSTHLLGTSEDFDNILLNEHLR